MTAAEQFANLFPGFNRLTIDQFPEQVAAYIDAVNGVKNSLSKFFTAAIESALAPVKFPMTQVVFGQEGVITVLLTENLSAMLLRPPARYKTEVSVPFTQFTFESVGDVTSDYFSGPNIIDRMLEKPVISGYVSGASFASMKLSFDRRLFSPKSAALRLKAWIVQFIGVTNTYGVRFVTPYAVADYSLEALLYLAENGVTADFIDYDKLSEFLIYVHAYEKNANQIKANFIAKKTGIENEITDFRQRLAAMAHQQNTYLQGVRMQIEANIKSDAQQQLTQLAAAKNSLNAYALQLKGICGH